jgi:hypothetical protein
LLRAVLGSASALSPIHPRSNSIAATLVIVDAHDVVLVEVFPALHLDHPQRLRAGFSSRCGNPPGMKVDSLTRTA